VEIEHAILATCAYLWTRRPAIF